MTTFTTTARPRRTFVRTLSNCSRTSIRTLASRSRTTRPSSVRPFILSLTSWYGLSTEAKEAAWETGNEWGQYMLKSAVPSADWTDSLARFIKALAPEHLVADGTNGFFDESGVLKTTAFDTKEADLITDHLYPASVWLLDKDRDTCQDKGSEKVFFIGELDVIGQSVLSRPNEQRMRCAELVGEEREATSWPSITRRTRHGQKRAA